MSKCSNHMSKIRFEIKDAKDLGYEQESGKVVHIYVDDQNLLDLVHNFQKSLGGDRERHEGTDPWWLYHRLKERESMYIFGCAGCLEPGCSPVDIEIEETSNSIKWINFRFPYWWDDKDKAGPHKFPDFEFEKEQYNTELEKLKKTADEQEARWNK